MDERQSHPNRYQYRPDMLPFTSGNELTPFQRQHDPQAAPRSTGAIVATTLGTLLLITLIFWLLLP